MFAAENVGDATSTAQAIARLLQLDATTKRGLQEAAHHVAVRKWRRHIVDVVSYEEVGRSWNMRGRAQRRPAARSVPVLPMAIAAWIALFEPPARCPQPASAFIDQRLWRASLQCAAPAYFALETVWVEE
ncbi:hypothetical protein XabCFBP2524_06690 [Xanthomonas axonopodis pv. begoniae]|nr:hypothetical protein XabCFBP2524_06690 [Xanthomonas axonopodis pv. begoniae]